MSGCSKTYDPETIAIETIDGKSIAGTFREAGKNRAVILLHMLGKDRTDWEQFAEKLHMEGYDVLAIDLRGHGESEGDWEKFSEQDFLNLVLDVQAARNYLKTSSLAIIGASIGANAGLVYASTDTDVAAAVLLSPGTSYRGVDISSAIGAFRRSLLMLSGEEDSYSTKSVLTLSTRNSQYEVKLYPGRRHGTDLLGHPGSDVQGEILNWLKEKYPVY